MQKILVLIVAFLLYACNEATSIKDNIGVNSLGGEISSGQNTEDQDSIGSIIGEQNEPQQGDVNDVSESGDSSQLNQEGSTADSASSAEINRVQQPENVEIVPENEEIQTSLEGLSNFFQVSDELYRSAQPTNGGLLSAQSIGIKTVLSFQLVNIDTTLEVTENTGLVFEHVPMVPWNVTFENIVDALKIIKNSEKPVLVHCLHGADRTGLVVAMYRIVFQDWSKEAAKDELVNGGFGYHDSLENITAFIDEVDIEAVKQLVFE